MNYYIIVFLFNICAFLLSLSLFLFSHLTLLICYKIKKNSLYISTFGRVCLQTFTYVHMCVFACAIVCVCYVNKFSQLFFYTVIRQGCVKKSFFFVCVCMCKCFLFNKRNCKVLATLYSTLLYL